jgi:hypothetical protein
MRRRAPRDGVSLSSFTPPLALAPLAIMGDATSVSQTVTYMLQLLLCSYLMQIDNALVADRIRLRISLGEDLSAHNIPIKESL